MIGELAGLINEVECLAIGVIVHTHRIAHHTPLTVLLCKVTAPAAPNLLYLRDSEAAWGVDNLAVNMRRLHQLHLFCRQLLAHVYVIALDVIVTLFVGINGSSRGILDIIAKDDILHERDDGLDYRVAVGTYYFRP